MRHKLSWGAAIVFVCALAAALSETKTGTPANAEPVSGKVLYSSYRALCHGSDGRGTVFSAIENLAARSDTADEEE